MFGAETETPAETGAVLDVFPSFAAAPDGSNSMVKVCLKSF